MTTSSRQSFRPAGTFQAKEPKPEAGAKLAVIATLLAVKTSIQQPPSANIESVRGNRMVTLSEPLAEGNKLPSQEKVSKVDSQAVIAESRAFRKATSSRGRAWIQARKDGLQRSKTIDMEVQIPVPDECPQQLRATPSYAEDDEFRAKKQLAAARHVEERKWKLGHRLHTSSRPSTARRTLAAGHEATATPRAAVHAPSWAWYDEDEELTAERRERLVRIPILAKQSALQDEDKSSDASECSYPQESRERNVPVERLNIQARRAIRCAQTPFQKAFVNWQNAKHMSARVKMR